MRDTCIANNLYNVDAIRELREAVAHELGHVLLHGDDILTGQLADYVSNPEKDAEANLFRDILLKFRRERHNAIQRQGGYW